jgi:hypothetical protein
MKVRITKDIKGELKVGRPYATRGEVLEVLKDRGDKSFLVKGKKEHFIVFEHNNDFELIN